MSWLGIGKEIADPVEAVGNALDKILTSDEEKAHGQAVMAEIRQKPQILQAEINKVEAQHRSVFVAGWRPAVGWMGVAGLGWHYIGHPMAAFLLQVVSPETPVPPLGDTSELQSLVIALLGIGAYRSFDKSRGTSK